MKIRAFLIGLGLLCAAAACAQTAPDRAAINKYCSGCHNDQLKTGGLSLTGNVKTQDWEKVIRKLRAGMMPPAGLPRPDAAGINALAASIENVLDQAAAANPNPGRPALHRLN